MFSKHRKIKNFLILPKFQLAICFLNFWVITLSYITLFFVIKGSFGYFDDLASFVNVRSLGQYQSFLTLYKNQIWTTFGVSALFCYFFSFVFTVYVSHKLAGPIYRMKQFFLDILLKGSVNEKLNFRKNDYYEDLPEIVNQALDKIKK